MPVVSTGQLTIVDVNDGVDGLDGPALSINASKAGFTFQDGVAVPAVQAIAFNAKRQGLTGDVVWSASDGMTFDSDDGALDLTGFALGYPATGDGDTVYLDLSDFGALRQGTVAASVDGLTSFYNVLRIDKSTAQANATRNVFVGNWAAGTSYLIGDVVLRDGYGWSCLQDHVSSISITPPTAPSTSNAYWTIYAVKGDTGIRGTITTAKAVAGSSWVDADADTAITEAGGGIPIQGDVVTLYNSAASYSQTRVRSSGGTWTALTAFFGGNVLVDGTITATKLAANAIAVGTAAIQTGAIVNAMIGNAAIDSGKIADAAITTAKIGDGQITNAKITDAAITNAKINDLSADKITAGTISADRIGVDTISIGKLASVLQTDNYSSSAGWQINKSGTATFNQANIRGSINGGSYVGYSWPAAGQSGYHLGPSGLLLGNYNGGGTYFQFDVAAGAIYSNGLSIVGGNATFSGKLSAAQISVGTSASATTFFDPAFATIGLRSNATGFLGYSGDTGTVIYVPQTCTDGKGNPYDCGYYIYAGAPVSSSELIFTCGDAATGFPRRVRSGLTRYVITAFGTVEHFLSIWYRTGQVGGAWNGWVLLGTAVEANPGYGSATVVAALEMSLTQGYQIQFGFSATDGNFNYNNGNARAINYGGLFVTAINF